MIPYVHSGYPRKENDDYQTIDERCVEALVETPEMGIGALRNQPNIKLVDICASHGSGIVSGLQRLGFVAEGLEQALVPLQNLGITAVVTNPPYDRRIVDKIVGHTLVQLAQNSGPLSAYFLMRANWDFAAGRKGMFDNPLYRGQLRMRFRPWWSEERKAQPIHNYVWHHWSVIDDDQKPIVSYWPRNTT
jgi:hypothetical protein